MLSDIGIFGVGPLNFPLGGLLSFTLRLVRPGTITAIFSGTATPCWSSSACSPEAGRPRKWIVRGIASETTAPLAGILSELVHTMANEVNEPPVARTWQGFKAFSDGLDCFRRYVLAGSTNQEELDRAKSPLELAVTLEPTFALAYYNLGLVYGGARCWRRPPKRIGPRSCSVRRSPLCATISVERICSKISSTGLSRHSAPSPNRKRTARTRTRTVSSPGRFRACGRTDWTFHPRVARTKGLSEGRLPVPAASNSPIGERETEASGAEEVGRWIQAYVAVAQRELGCPPDACGLARCRGCGSATRSSREGAESRPENRRRNAENWVRLATVYRLQA